MTLRLVVNLNLIEFTKMDVDLEKELEEFESVFEQNGIVEL
jgi:hypothetical protein